MIQENSGCIYFIFLHVLGIGSCHGLHPGKQLMKMTGRDGLSHANSEFFNTDFVL